jgi:hypothetical protein
MIDPLMIGGLEGSLALYPDAVEIIAISGYGPLLLPREIRVRDAFESLRGENPVRRVGALSAAGLRELQRCCTQISSTSFIRSGMVSSNTSAIETLLMARR